METKESLTDNRTYINIIRWYLTGILFIMPLKGIIAWNIKPVSKVLSIFFNHCDEITIIIFFPLAIWEFYKNRKIIDVVHLIILFPVLLLVLFGFISGIKNGNAFTVTALGMLEYILNFLVIFIYAAFFRKVSEFRRIFRLLLIMAIFLGVIAIIQELWALVSIYIYGKNISDSEIYILRNIPLNNRILASQWRYGIYRPPSFIQHPNTLGLFSLLIFTLYSAIVKNMRVVVLPLITGILLSISRMVYAGFLYVFITQIIRGRRWIVVLLVPLLISILLLSFLPDFNIYKGHDISYYSENQKPIPWRVYSRSKAMEIWKDHPFLGVGPGKVGGHVSERMKSHIYDEYSFHKTYFFKNFKTLDQFWPQVLAELGLIGSMTFVALFISLFAALSILKNRADHEEIKGLFAGLLTFTAVIIIYCFGLRLNYPVILFTYSAFFGLGLGIINKHGRDSS